MSIRTLSLAAAASPLLVLAAALPAFAQDDPWTGFYVGGNLGANWGNSKLNATVAPGNGSSVIPPQDVTYINATGVSDSTKTGFTGGIEGGYNYRAGDWVFGLETEFVALDVNDRSSGVFTPPVINPGPQVTYRLDQRAQTSWMWSLRPRIGYVFGDWMAYGTAGVASSDLKVSMTFSDSRTPQNVVTNSNSSTKTGYIAGLGAAYAFSPNMSFKGEWLYAGFGNVKAIATGPNGFVAVSSKATVDTNLFRVGLDYRF